MDIKVTDFKWEKGKNDLEYIALLQKNIDAMTYNLMKCAKTAREQYNKGRESAFKEIAYSEDLGLTKESEYEKRIRADERAKLLESLRIFLTQSGYGSDGFLFDLLDKFEQLKEQEHGKSND